MAILPKSKKHRNLNKLSLYNISFDGSFFLHSSVGNITSNRRNYEPVCKSNCTEIGHKNNLPEHI